jgi:oligopeptide/dipeptide ABC transporter ATP-binding protein
VVAETVESIAVMYAGRIVETGSVEEVLLSPKHPYTQGLLNSIPSERKRGKELSAIQGVVPNPFRMPPGCKFQPRCPFQWDRCATEPSLIQVGGPDRRSRCWLQAPEEAERRHAFEADVATTVSDVVG